MFVLFEELLFDVFRRTQTEEILESKCGSKSKKEKEKKRRKQTKKMIKKKKKKSSPQHHQIFGNEKGRRKKAYHHSARSAPEIRYLVIYKLNYSA